MGRWVMKALGMFLHLMSSLEKEVKVRNGRIIDYQALYDRQGVFSLAPMIVISLFFLLV
jgi:hypothetical protein